MTLTLLFQALREAASQKQSCASFRAQLAADWLESALKAGDLKDGDISYKDFNSEISTMYSVISGEEIITIVPGYLPFIRHHRHESFLPEVVSLGEVSFQLNVVRGIPCWDKLARRHYRRLVVRLQLAA